MQIRQGIELNWIENVNQKADSFSAAPMSEKRLISLEFGVPCQEF
jgi:hypothetical protein